MKDLADYLLGYPSCAVMRLDYQSWITDARIPDEPGWYFIRTSAPLTVLQQQERSDSTDGTRNAHKVTGVRNYDIAGRARRYDPVLAGYWNVAEVYSGTASSLRSRARDHTWPDPDAAGLALARYPALRHYDWLFGFLTLRRFARDVSCPEMLLRLGEQIWRSRNGWPLLSAE